MQELPRGGEVLPGLKPTEPPHFHDPPLKGEAKGEGGGGKRCQGNRNFTCLETD